MTYYEEHRGRIHLQLGIEAVGGDYVAVLSGGTSPHIGAAVLAVPRHSLADPDAPSCTSSVLNRTGHKDEDICRACAEDLCRSTKHACVCTGGFHCDDMTAEEIAAVKSLAKILTMRCAAALCEVGSDGREEH